MKKILSVILALALVAGTGCVAFAAQGQSFTSSPSEWAKPYVSAADKNGIFDSSSSDMVYQEYINREDFCNLAYDTLAKSDLADRVRESTGPFTDTTNTKVGALYSIGIIKGKGNSKFAPEDGLTREEAATILWRMLSFAGATASYKGDLYPDNGDISDWANDAVYAIRDLGIMEGMGNGFVPKGSYTGEQAITTMVRALELLNEAASVPVSDDKSFADKINAQMPSDKNYTFSPLSIKLALAMAANGSEGETQKEITDAIGVKDLDSYNKSVQTLMDKFSQSDLLRLNISNSIWINKDSSDLRYSQKFISTLKQYYDAHYGEVTEADKVQKVNGWVNDKTVGKINGIIDDSTRFDSLIVNAVYFKGRWESEFSRNSTAPDTFTDRNGNESKIDFMNKRKLMNYSESGGVKIVELPYQLTQEVRTANGISSSIKVETLKGIDVSMYLLMSDREYDPEAAIKDADFNYTELILSVPKFKVEYSTSLNGILNNIGISKAYTDYAEFQPMYESGNSKIMDTIHKTYINVDEEGTEAAAVTAIISCATAMPSEPVIVKYNKPFTYVIMDNVSGEILFMGEYAFTK